MKFFTFLEKTFDSPPITLVQKSYTEYPFEFTLPSSLPSTFIGKYGMIRYQVEASLKKADKKSTQWNKSAPISVIFPYTVNGIVDLNVEPWANQPIETTKDWKKGNRFCLPTAVLKQDMVGFSLWVPKSGFVPGQDLNFTAELFHKRSGLLNIGASKDTMHVVAKLIQVKVMLFFKISAKKHFKISMTPPLSIL